MHRADTDIGPMVPAADAFAQFAWTDLKADQRCARARLHRDRRGLRRGLLVRLQIESRSNEKEAQLIAHRSIARQPVLRYEQVHLGIQRRADLARLAQLLERLSDLIPDRQQFAPERS